MKKIKNLVILGSALFYFACGDDGQSSSAIEDSPEGRPLETLDEDEYASNTPNVADLEVSGDTLFALFQRYVYDAATYTTTFDPGLLALFDVKTGAFLDSIQLRTKNPQAVKVVDGVPFVATMGEYNENWGIDADDNRGIEKVDLKKGKSSLWVGGSKLGGGAYFFDVDRKRHKAFVAVYKAYQDVPAVEVDLKTGKVEKVKGIVDAEGGLAVDEKKGIAYIGDRLMDYGTSENHVGVYKYDGKSIKGMTGEDEVRTPASIALVEGVPYVYSTDFVNTGTLYTDYADSHDKGLDFDTDSKLAVAGDRLFVLQRIGKGSVVLLEDGGENVSSEVSAADGNPYDVAPLDDSHVWVAMHNESRIRKLSIEKGKFVDGDIETRAFCKKK